jgi:hypothetical protein
MTFNFLFHVVGLMIYGVVFGAQQVARGFWFHGFYFVGLGWFVICVDVALFFC